MDFELLLKQLKENLLAVLKEKYPNLRGQSKKDIEAFIKSAKEKLERWVLMLSKSQINLEEFEWLLQSQKDLLSLKQLYATGTSKIALGHLKNKIIKVVLDTVKVALLVKK